MLDTTPRHRLFPDDGGLCLGEQLSSQPAGRRPALRESARSSGSPHCRGVARVGAMWRRVICFGGAVAGAMSEWRVEEATRRVCGREVENAAKLRPSPETVAWCRDAQARAGVRPGASWGSLDKPGVSFWMDSDCNGPCAVVASCDACSIGAGSRRRRGRDVDMPRADEDRRSRGELTGWRGPAVFAESSLDGVGPGWRGPAVFAESSLDGVGPRSSRGGSQRRRGGRDVAIPRRRIAVPWIVGSDRLRRGARRGRLG